MSTQEEQIKEAKKGNAILWGANREIRRLAEHLNPNEVVYKIVVGTPEKGRGRGIIVATNERIFFSKDGWIFRDSQDFGYDTFSSVEFKTGIFFGTFVLYGKGDETRYNYVGRFAGAKFTKLVRQLAADFARNARSSYSPQSNGLLAPIGGSAPASREDTILRQLAELGQLRDKGILNANEFEIKKQDLLNRL